MIARTEIVSTSVPSLTSDSSGFSSSSTLSNANPPIAAYKKKNKIFKDFHTPDWGTSIDKIHKTYSHVECKQVCELYSIKNLLNFA